MQITQIDRHSCNKWLPELIMPSSQDDFVLHFCIPLPTKELCVSQSEITFTIMSDVEVFCMMSCDHSKVISHGTHTCATTIVSSTFAHLTLDLSCVTQDIVLTFFVALTKMISCSFEQRRNNFPRIVFNADSTKAHCNCLNDVQGIGTGNGWFETTQ